MHIFKVIHQTNRNTVAEFHAEDATEARDAMRAWYDDCDIEELELYALQIQFNGVVTSTIWLCDWNDLFSE